jgi:hypothetical protein
LQSLVTRLEAQQIRNLADTHRVCSEEDTLPWD